MPINCRTILGAVIINYLLNLSDRETVQQVKQNMFMKNSPGYSSFTNKAPIRQQLSLAVINTLNDIAIAHSFRPTGVAWKSQWEGQGPDMPYLGEFEKEIPVLSVCHPRPLMIAMHLF